jgi:hypothetical protein
MTITKEEQELLRKLLDQIHQALKDLEDNQGSEGFASWRAYETAVTSANEIDRLLFPLHTSWKEQRGGQW